MKLALIGVGLVVFAQVFCFLETAYFGYNWTSQSPAETICDTLALLLSICGVVLVCKA